MYFIVCMSEFRIINKIIYRKYKYWTILYLIMQLIYFKVCVCILRGIIYIYNIRTIKIWDKITLDNAVNLFQSLYVYIQDN
jgi:hypothetical protein